MGKNKEELLAMAKENSETKKGNSLGISVLFSILVVLFKPLLILIISFLPVRCLLN